MPIVELQAGVELKACPLCGCEAVLKEQGWSKLGADKAYFYWVKCTNKNCAIAPAAVEVQSAAIDL